MSTAIEMTLEEEERIFEEQGDALLSGNFERANELASKMPLPAALVPWAEKWLGEEFVKERGISKMFPER